MNSNVTNKEKKDFISPMNLSKQELGQWGEELATNFLIRQNYSIIENNWSCNLGEVDIIAENEDSFVFIEVKTRRGKNNVIPENAVTAQKQDRYKRLAQAYSITKNIPENKELRFDTIAILVIDERKAKLRHYMTSFEFDE